MGILLEEGFQKIQIERMNLILPSQNSISS